MSKNDVPVLLIGLGGIGSSIVDTTYAKLHKACGDGFVEALVFDTDEAELSRLEHIPRDCKIQTSTDKSVRYVLERDRNARSWFPIHDKILNMNLIKGAGQIRAVSRLALRAAMKEGKLSRVENVKDRLYRIGGNAPDKGIRIVIVSSLMGGTGSGMFLQIPLYLREVMQSRFGADRIDIQGVFLLPDVLKRSITKSEQRNVYANAYASMKELNAIVKYLAKEKRAVPVELEYRPDQLLNSGSNDSIVIKDWPYDYCYIYDYENERGENLGDLSGYKELISENLFSQVYGPMSDKIHSHFINETRSIIRKNSKNIFGGIGMGKLVYPYEDICDYVNNKIIFENLKDKYLRIDIAYNNELKQINKRIQEGEDVEKPSKSAHYIQEFNLQMQEEDRFFKSIKKALLEFDDQKQDVNKVADKYLLSLENLIDEQTANFISEYKIKQPESKELEGAINASLVKSKVRTREEVLKEYRRIIETQLDNIGEGKANNDFKFYDDDVESEFEKEYLKNGDKYINPVGIRYVLYKIKEVLENKKKDFEKDLEPAENGLKKREEKKLETLFPDKKSLDEKIDTAYSTSIISRIMNIFKNKKKLFIDNYNGESQQHFSKLKAYSKVRFGYSYCKRMEFLIDKLIEEYEGMFSKLDEQRAGIVKRIELIDKKYRKDKENNKSMNIYVLGEKKYFEKILNDIPAHVYDKAIEEVLPEKMHKSLVANCKKKLKEKVVEYIGYENLFNTLVINGCKEKLLSYEEVKEVLNINIVKAIVKEYEYAKELNEYSDVKDERMYIKDKLSELKSFTRPFAAATAVHDNDENNEDGEDGENSVSSNYKVDSTSRYLVWGLKNDLRLPNESPIDKPLVEEMIDSLSDENGQTIVRDENHSEYEIEFIHNLYGLFINDFSKLSDDENREGEYYKSYAQVISHIPDTYGEIDEDVEITPHIDKNWHLILPDIGKGRSNLNEMAKAKAFVASLPMQFVIIEKRKVGTNKNKFEYKDKTQSPATSIVTSKSKKVEGNICEFYEGIHEAAQVVQRINERINEYIKDLGAKASMTDNFDDYKQDKYIECLINFSLENYSEVHNILDLFIVLFKESRQIEVAKKNEIFKYLIDALCELLEQLVEPYVGIEKEAKDNAVADTLKRIIKESNLSKGLGNSAPESTTILTPLKDKLAKYDEDK